ncbi:MAG TPA: undecaprenyl-phosphate glucose phosphotransferase [Pedobacter sp.]|uniref:undecaprenyl-phosphate glucose phosphotransferase n=1 Tax=Pedobacter sp. TaxID=1411316 RepID=UPI002BCF4D01|nr:undecaprenyl-phosphate glucose phosphotransferase [Pedobacter sp.]HMI01424.1 undecaprenyl-phosphate glucose phosphotransferase [Pedobacter sp.]
MTIQTRYIYLLRYILPVTDVIMLNLIYFMAYYLTDDFANVVSNEINKNYIIVCNLIWLLSTALFSLYTAYGARKMERIYRGTWRSVVFHFVLFSIYLMFSRDLHFSRTFLVVFYLLLIAAFILNRFLGTSLQYMLISRFNVAKKVAVMGSNYTALRISAYLKKETSLEFYGFVGEDDNVYCDEDGFVSDIVSKRLTKAAESGVKEVYVTVAPQRMAEVRALIEEADRQCMRLKFIPDLAGSLSLPYTISYLGDEFPIITLRNEPLEEMSARFKKRVFDVLFSGMVIVFILSWLYPIIAILIKMQSGGPALFTQERSGRDDKPFLCYKFRSMRVNCDCNTRQATRDDDRITAIGRFLRRTSLDEMPQFFNVFAGHMSVVGPRPHMLKHTEQYKTIINQFMVRHFLKPGITGWAQVNGCRGETRKKRDMENRVKYDLYYLENWSAMLDVKITFMTIINAIRGEENAY